MVTRTSQRGTALVLVLLTIGVLSAIGLGLSVSSSMVRMITANQDEAMALANAADAALHLAARDLAPLATWDEVLSGTRTSTLIDGAPGLRSVAYDFTLDLVRLTSELTCGVSSGCPAALVHATTADRPWGVNNPRWQLFLHSPLPSPSMPAGPMSLYVVVWIGDDGAETDGDPLTDGAGAGQEGRYIVRARAEAFGPRGARHAIEAELARVCTNMGAGEVCAPGIRVQSWRAVSSAVP